MAAGERGREERREDEKEGLVGLGSCLRHTLSWGGNDAIKSVRYRVILCLQAGSEER